MRNLMTNHIIKEIFVLKIPLRKSENAGLGIEISGLAIA